MDPDILLLNDVGPIKDTTHIAGYSTYFSNTNNENHRGAAIAVRRGIRHELVTGFLGDMVAVKVLLNGEEITFGTVYLPPRDDAVPTQDLLRLFNRQSPVYLIADLNAHHSFIGHSTNDRVGNFLNELISRNKIKHIGPDFNTYTGAFKYISKPDLVLTNNKAHHNYHIEAGTPNISDHFPVKLTLSINPIQIPIPARKAPSKTDWDKFSSLCDVKVTRKENAPVNQVTVLAKAITDCIKNAAEKATPVISYRVLPHFNITEEMKDLYRELEIELRPLLWGNNWGRTNHTVAAIRERLGTLCKEAQSEQMNKTIDMIRNNGKMDKDAWKHIKRMNGNNKRGNIRTKMVYGDVKLNSEQEIRDAFVDKLQKQFVISDEENRHFDRRHDMRVNRWLIRHSDQAHYRPTIDTSALPRTGIGRPISESDVRNTIKEFKERAPGYSGLTAQYFKHLPNTMITQLTYLYNTILATGYYPMPFKFAEIAMIPKAGKSVKDIDSYRPISLLDLTGKILEKILNKRLVFHLERHDLYHPDAHGFRNKRGTGTALAVATETIAKALKERSKVTLVLRDVKGAFDKVWKNGLKYKIWQLGMPVNFARTLCGFLDWRTALVKYGGAKSEVFRLRSGVPQGSVLSPTLYNIFLRDLPPAVNRSKQVIYADDVSQIIITKAQNADQHAQKVKRDMDVISSFERRWKIQTCKNKFKIIPIRNRSHYAFKRIGLKTSKSGTMLGLTIGNRGYATHVNNTIHKAKSRLYKLFKFRDLALKQKRILYTALVKSILTYPTIPMCSIAKTNTVRLQRVQNLAAKLITNYRYEEGLPSRTAKSLHDEAGLEALNMYVERGARRTWATVQTVVPDVWDYLHQRAPQIRRDNHPFPQTLKTLQTNTTPVYTLQDTVVNRE
jgi:hypothetical protein